MVAGDEPKSTAVAAVRPVPETVTGVPPNVDPVDTVSPVTTGGVPMVTT